MLRINPALLVVSVVTLLVFGLPGQLLGLKRSEVLIVANKNSPEGLRLADYYRKKRNMPASNVVTVSVTVNESCSRRDYDRDLKGPLKTYLTSGVGKKIKCLLLMYGIPLRIRSQPSDKVVSHATDKDTSASVDSELTLVKRDGYRLGGWVKNPYYLNNPMGFVGSGPDDIVMVSRLDASSPKIVRQIIRDSINTEQKELKGTAYFDARWSVNGATTGSAYRRYDRSIHRTADIVKQSGKLQVVLDTNPSLFQPGDCNSAALYCGWYSLATYVDAFEWQKGSIAYHIASAECVTLKDRASQVWCKKMLEDGVAATIGPVGEPYVQAFPVPELFFGQLIKGFDTLVEVYFFSLPYLSWKMVLIGDPLYRPFDAFSAHP